MRRYLPTLRRHPRACPGDPRLCDAAVPRRGWPGQARRMTRVLSDDACRLQLEGRADGTGHAEAGASSLPAGGPAGSRRHLRGEHRGTDGRGLQREPAGSLDGSRRGRFLRREADEGPDPGRDRRRLSRRLHCAEGQRGHRAFPRASGRGGPGDRHDALRRRREACRRARCCAPRARRSATMRCPSSRSRISSRSAATPCRSATNGSAPPPWKSDWCRQEDRKLSS